MKKNRKTDPKTAFTLQLMRWNNASNNRQMPWKGEKDPYKIWLSEIILQQTRVEQGLKYYNDFVANYPTVSDLALAPEQELLKRWEGLGYYSRCRNLISTARFIHEKLGGKFPDTYEGILSLKGVGPYTAAAISSFAYQLPHAVVDGNVFRVLARVFGIKTPTDSSEGKKYFTALAGSLLDRRQPGIYNQAIMDFGATVCKPLAPLCTTCPFQKNCTAFLQKEINAYPVKGKKITMKKRNFFYLVISYRGRYAIRQRTAKDIWRGLFEFPCIESGTEFSGQKAIAQAVKEKWMVPGQFVAGPVSDPYKQQLTHQQITARFQLIQLKKKPATGDWQWVLPAEWPHYAFPRLFREFNQTLFNS